MFVEIIGELYGESEVSRLRPSIREGDIDEQYQELKKCQCHRRTARGLDGVEFWLVEFYGTTTQ